MIGVARTTSSRRCFGVYCRSLSRSFASDRGGTRTLDQRINIPHRLSPTIVTSSLSRLLATSSTVTS